MTDRRTEIMARILYRQHILDVSRAAMTKGVLDARVDASWRTFCGRAEKALSELDAPVTLDKG